MGAYTRTYSLTDGTIAYGSQVAFELDALGSSANNIVNAQIASGAAIADSKLAQITTASKVSGAALTSLTSIPAGAGVIPSANLPAAVVPAFENYLLHVDEEQTANTAGGTFTSGAWRTRVLNTSKTNQISGASLGSNQITLPAGTYYIEAVAPATSVNNHQAKLRNITDSSDIIIGTSGYANASSTFTTHSFVMGRFTLAAQKVLELQHQCATTEATDGFGKQANLGVVEVYAEVRIWKVA